MQHHRYNVVEIRHSSRGMTFLEVLVVLLVLGALTLTAFVRLKTGTVELTATADSISARLRLVQTLAMNNSQGLWGIRFESSTRTYHMFHCVDDSDCDMDRDIEKLPGADTDTDGRISLIDSNPGFKKDANVAFDDFGRPYEIKNKKASLLKNNAFTLTLEDEAGNTHDILVTPKTGFIP